MPSRVSPLLRATQSSYSRDYVCVDCLAKARSAQSKRRYVHLAIRLQPSTRSTTTKASSAQVSPSPISRDARSRRRAYTSGSLASSSAINAPLSIPAEHRQLHQHLVSLQDTAGSYVDLSRIQLAIRSLESTEPTIRVALLGLGEHGSLTARQLARVLLSDPLAEEQAWEQELLIPGIDGRSLLLKFGSVEDSVQSSPLVQTMHIPSPFLQRRNLEILITPLNVEGSNVRHPASGDLAETLLVPSLTTPTSAGGRVGFVRYPVHKAVVVADGITGAIQYGRLASSLAGHSLTTATLNLPLKPSSGDEEDETDISNRCVDLDLASRALTLFRADNANGAEFSSQWQMSRLPVISDWIAGSNDTNHSATIKDLINSTLLDTEQAITHSESQETLMSAANTVSDAKRKVLQSAVSEWSSEAHRDLQDNLGAAIASPLWRRTAWWRLFWRVDDVTISTADLLRRSWLTEAEQNLAFLSGRLAEAGLASNAELKGTQASPLITEEQKETMQEHNSKNVGVQSLAEALQLPSLLSEVQRQTGINALFDPPWPQTINLSRQYMIHRVIPDLHIKAQALLFTSVSTIGGSVGLAAWFYIATGGLGLYEAGAIASFGLVWGLRRLQKRWSKERQDFTNTLQEDGRKVLLDVEKRLRHIIHAGGRSRIRAEDTKSWQIARESVENCRKALRQEGQNP